MSRKQCAKCPWRVDANPNDIPNGYCETKHRNLTSTIAEPGAIPTGDTLRMMACHETNGDKQLPCAGWLIHQLNEGNNIGLRMAVAFNRLDADVELIGEQHRTLEDTFPS